MTHKQKCVSNCREHLESRNLLHVYDAGLFEHYYRKNNGTMGNAFTIGLHTADMMITYFEPKNLLPDD